ncbi:divergent polysaccharide deacetylase family protein [Alkaliphilus transvaalensis]|uniref:divergent polysaccharide deacetylase family protein n=1 Tax=Alkaliphilus transvaalensis TaxID=114628 RepID=UPI00047E51C0|nr:divergent polysaccharide deacetylase family protein [Alkaliphilus transvaalensis]
MNKKVHLLVIPKKIMLYLVIGFALILILVLFNRFRGEVPAWNFSNISRSQSQLASGKAGIIIDDFGNESGGSLEMLNLEIPITCAIMPFQPKTKEHAELAHLNGHEVIIHLPMEPHKGDPNWLGEKGITSGLSTEEIKNIVREAIEDVPYAVGLNNHMGSKATEDPRVMEAIISVLKENNMYIVDSKTSMKSVVKEVADKFGTPSIERTIFLDNEKHKGQIKRQIKELGNLAIKNNQAVAIGHVGPEGGLVTVEAINEMIQELEKMGVQFVKISQLF